MDEFRRGVIRLAESVQVAGMVVTTLAGGLTGMGLGRMIALASGSQGGGAAFVGFLIGGGLAFVLAATAAAIFFTLSETASNTARIAELLRNGDSPPYAASNPTPATRHRSLSTPPSSPTQPNQHATPNATSEAGVDVVDVSILENWKGRDGELLFPTAKAIIKQAVDFGYTVILMKSNDITLISPAGGETYCRSNQDILRAGRYIRRN